VVDHEIRKGEVIISEFFSDAYTMSLEGGRWFPVTLYADKGAKGGEAPAGNAAGGLAEAERVARGRGLHLFPFPLNLSLLCPIPLNLSSLCPPCDPK